MASGVGRSWFVGCACDRKFVQHTAVMLTSLDANGEVPEATVIVAGFGLTPDDVAVLRAGAGRLGSRLRVVDVTDEMLAGFTGIEFRSEYPLPVLGRLFIPEVVDVPNARLLTLDSDMIVNRPVRPLFELDMNDQYIGAIHDVPRIEDLNYFNSGLMLIEVDVYNALQVAERALTWLMQQDSHPTFPDQDALNTVVGDRWFRLDRSWNWFYTGPDRGDEPLDLRHYAAANVAHFAGGKPWNHYYHAGRPLYLRYVERLEEKQREYEAIREHVDEGFIAMMLGVLLGGDAEGDVRLRRWSSEKATTVISRLVRSTDFALKVVLPLKTGGELKGNVWQQPLRHSEKLWIADHLPLGLVSQESVKRATSWREVLSVLLADTYFTDKFGLSAMLALADALIEQKSAAKEQIDGVGIEGGQTALPANDGTLEAPQSDVAPIKSQEAAE